MKHSVVFLGHKVDSQGVHPAGAVVYQPLTFTYSDT